MNETERQRQVGISLGKYTEIILRNSLNDAPSQTDFLFRFK